MSKYITCARYAPCGLGYQVWAPGEDSADFWFSMKKEVFEFCETCGWKIRAI